MTDDEAPKPSTYFHQALADPLPGGRWAGRRPNIVGTEPTATPLAVPDWCIDPTGPEPPLGYSVDVVAVASTEAEGMAEDLLPSEAMPEASVIDEPTLHDEAEAEGVPPTYLGTLSSIGRRRDFHIVSKE
jgi:hypothetical protein